MIAEEKTVERWINEDPRIKDYLHKTHDLYHGPLQFIRNGRKTFQAKLDCDKLHSGCGGKTLEAYFELNLSKKKNGKYKDFFYLKIIMIDKSINTIKLF